MILVWALSWWYGAGWKARVQMVRERLLATFDYFSIDLLARTLFSPFRQISAGKVRGPLGVQWRAFVDRLVSRGIGALIRSFMIIIGTVWLAVQATFGLFVIVLWAAVPLLPVVGFIAMISGWVPQWM